MKQFAPFEFLQKSVTFKLHQYQNFAFLDWAKLLLEYQIKNSGIENSTLDCDSLPNFWISLALITLWLRLLQFLSDVDYSETFLFVSAWPWVLGPSGFQLCHFHSNEFSITPLDIYSVWILCTHSFTHVHFHIIVNNSIHAHFLKTKKRASQGPGLFLMQSKRTSIKAKIDTKVIVYYNKSCGELFLWN